jgi:hypothetical protein
MGTVCCACKAVPPRDLPDGGRAYRDPRERFFTGKADKMGSEAQERRSMDDGEELNRAKIEEASRIMGRYLLERGTLGEITIYGGSAILFQFDWRRTSEDVDARIISGGHHGLVTRPNSRQAARPAAIVAERERRHVCTSAGTG